MKRASKTEDIITNYCVHWYRVHGNDCEFSVWKLIRLVNGAIGRIKIDESELERAFTMHIKCLMI